MSKCKAHREISFLEDECADKGTIEADMISGVVSFADHVSERAVYAIYDFFFRPLK